MAMFSVSSVLKLHPELSTRISDHNIWTPSHFAILNSAIQPEPVQPSIPPQQKTLPLPLELRLKIYNHVFLPSYTAIWRTRTRSRNQKNHPPPIPSTTTNILRVSSTIHAEASQFLYSTRHFHFDILTPHPIPPCIYTPKLSQPRNIHLKVHCFRDCESAAHRRVAILNRILHSAAKACPGGRRNLEIDTNVHGFRRLAMVKGFGDVFGQFESVRIYACVNSADMVKARDWLAGDEKGWVLAPQACREHMVELVERMRMEVGEVRVVEREVKVVLAEWERRGSWGCWRGSFVRIEVLVTPGKVGA